MNLPRSGDKGISLRLLKCGALLTEPRSSLSIAQVKSLRITNYMKWFETSKQLTTVMINKTLQDREENEKG